MPRAVRTYTDADREAVRIALETHGGDAGLAATATGIPRTTIISWRDKPLPAGMDALPPALVEAAVEHLRQDKRGEVLTAAWDLAAAAFKRAEAALPDAGARDAAIVGGIAVDKAQLLSGEATSRQEVRGTVTHEPNPDSIAAILNVLCEAGLIPPAPHQAGDSEAIRLLSA